MVILAKRILSIDTAGGLTYLDASIIVPDSNFRQSTGFRAASFNTREVEYQFNWMLALEAT